MNAEPPLTKSDMDHAFKALRSDMEHALKDLRQFIVEREVVSVRWVIGSKLPTFSALSPRFGSCWPTTSHEPLRRSQFISLLGLRGQLDAQCLRILPQRLPHQVALRHFQPAALPPQERHLIGRQENLAPLELLTGRLLLHFSTFSYS